MEAARCFSREPLRVRTKDFIIVRMQNLGNILFHIVFYHVSVCMSHTVYSVPADSNFHLKQ